MSMSMYSRSTLRWRSWNSAVEDCLTTVLDTLRGSRGPGRPMLKFITLTETVYSGGKSEFGNGSGDHVGSCVR